LGFTDERIEAMTWDHHYLFTGPDGVPVAVSVLRDATMIYPGSREEPPDYRFKTRLVVNERDVDPVHHHALVKFVEEYGARR
jgi:hypothetical protein